MDPVYRAIADPIRRAILDRLAVGECSVNQLAALFPVTQQAVSHHLATLRGARLVTSRRIRREHRYRLTAAPLREVMTWLGQYRRFIDPAGHHWRVIGGATNALPRRTGKARH
jgi:DNA-binding transcriptional ArsR family regulator